jgi:hypothetical protein
MAVTRIKNNQVTDASGANTQLGINANTKLQNFSITSGKLANNLTYGSDLTITGNLTVQGNSTTIDTTITTIEDPLIVLASTQTSGAPAVDIGFIGFRGNESNIAFVWDESADSFVTAFTSTGESNTTITITSLANLQVANLSLTGNVLGALNVTGNVTGGNLLTPGLISATANITGGNVLTGGLISATSNITGGNLLYGSGIVSGTGNVYAANFFGNITGNIDAAGANTQVQFNDGDLLGASAAFTFDKASNALVNSGDVTGGNLFTGGLISAVGNINTNSPRIVLSRTAANATAANLSGIYVGDNGNIASFVYNSADDRWFTGNQGLATLANVNAGNLRTTGLISATGNVDAGNVLTAGLISATSTITSAANVAGANLVTTGGTFTDTLTTTGNALVGGNLIVQGNITYINIDDLRIEDPVIILGTGPNGAPLTVNDGKDRGVFMEYFITAGNVLANAFMGYDNSTGNMFLATNVTMANDVVTVVSYGTLQAGNLDIQSAVASGNITGGNLLTGGLISATGVTTTGNVTGGNLLYGSGIVSGTGNVYATNFIGNISGNIDAGGANTNIQFNDGDILNGSAGFTFNKVGNVVTANGNITGATLISNGNILATSAANVTFGDNTWMYTGYTTLNTSGIFHDTGANPDTIQTSTNSRANGIAMFTSGLANSFIQSTGGIEFITAGTLNANTTPSGGVSRVQITTDGLTANGIVSASGNVTGANLILTAGIIDGPAAGRITINGSDIDTDFAVDGDTLANVFYVDAGTGTASFGSSTQITNAIVNFATTTSIKTPVGNTTQRPATGVTGMLRFNTTSNALEIYNNTEWESVGVPVFTVIADQQFAGDGSTVAFTLGSTQTTNSCIVSINGVVQIPTLAYSVSGTDPTCVLTFTEAPASGDVIDVRQITTTTSVTQISNGTGNAAITVIDTSNVVTVTGALSVTGGIIGLSSNSISDGTSSVTVISSGGNIRSNIAGTTVQTISPGLVAITGDLSVSGNATLSGNILGDRLENGTTNIEIITPGGNANISVGGVSNVALFTTGGLELAGNITFNGNIIDTGALSIITGSNGNLSLLPNGTGNINTGANIMPTANATANIGSAALSYNTIFAKATSAQYADLAEKYAADAEYAPGTVVAFGGTQEVTICSNDACSRVAGVISTNPSYRMNDGLVSEHTAMVALTGRVPTSVTGTVRKGDLMVSAGNGVARAEANPAVGTVIGKALADSQGDAVIEVVVGRV